MGSHAKRMGNFQKNFDSGRTLAALNSSHIIRVNVGFFSKSFLTEPGFHPAFEDGLADNLTLFLFKHSAIRKQK